MGTKTFQKLLYSELGLLVVQYLLGMYVNLYVDVPSTLTAAFWESQTTLIIIAHMWVGAALLGIAIYLAIRSSTIRIPGVRTSSLSGLLWVSFAFLSGIAFLFGGANNLFSYAMAAGFLFAVMSFGFAAGAMAFQGRQRASRT